MGKKHKNGSKPSKHAKKLERDQRQMHRKKRERIKYGGDRWNADFKKLSEQLLALGLVIKDVAGDGNCLFRSIADQLETNPNKHVEYRKTIVDYMSQNREMFEPFLGEDDGTFDDYVRGMRENAMWGGNLEIQAASLAYKINVIIYQLDHPRWEVVNFADPQTRTIQLSYLDGDHYASVRPIDANNATVVHTTTVPAHLTSPKPTTATTSTTTPPPPHIPTFQEDWCANDLELMIMDQTGNYDLATVRRTLEEHDYDTDAVIAFLLTISDHTDNYELDEALAAAVAVSNGADLPPTHNTTTTTTTSAEHHEGHLHKAVNKISKHIPHPHHHYKESKKGKRKQNQKSNAVNNLDHHVPPPPANIKSAIKEMGSLSI